MLNVVHVITSLDDGGAEAVLYRLISRSRSVVRHRVVSLMSQGKYGPMIEKVDVPVHAIDFPRRRLTVRGFYRLRRLLGETKPDVVQTWMYHGDLVGGIAARSTALDCVVWGIHHTSLDPDDTPFSTRMTARACAMLSGWIPRAIVSCSRRGVETHRAIGYPDNFTVISNGYDTTAFSEDPASRARVRDELGVDDNAILIGLVGRWNPQKDHQNLLHAMSIVATEQTRVVAVLVGTGCTDQNAELTQLVRKLGLVARVRLCGPRNDIPAVMNALDLHVLSSSHGEAFPNVVAEAMACGTPCVVTDVGDAALIVGDTGWVVPPRDSSALAQAIVVALQERSERTHPWQARQAACRRRIADNFSIELMTDAYCKLWSRVAGIEVELPSSVRGVIPE